MVKAGDSRAQDPHPVLDGVAMVLKRLWHAIICRVADEIWSYSEELSEYEVTCKRCGYSWTVGVCV